MVVIKSSSFRSLYRLMWQPCCVLLAFCFVRTVAIVAESQGNSSLSNDQLSQEPEAGRDCIDWEGKPVADGEKYIPYGSDLCMQCLCKNRFPILCQSVACSAPQNCPNAKSIAGKCCEYECFPGDSKNDGNSTGIGKDPAKDADESITNLSLRLIASTVTSLLFLALLLFMVYRLRQRRLLLAMRRFEARSRISNNEDTDSEHYIPDNLLSLECPPYTDPPPPYSPPKPPHIYQGEQPPPYDEINITGNLNGREVNGLALQPRYPPASVREFDAGGRTRCPTPQQPSCQVPGDRQLSPLSAADSQGQASVRYAVETLPAYASTDVVQGLDNILTTRAPVDQRSWNSSNGNNNNHNNSRYTDRGGGRVEARNTSHDRNGFVNNASSGHNHHHPPTSSSLDHSANERNSMPTVTAFQKFSSLFKRNAPKSKNRSGHARPMSECHHPPPPPPQYATLPHNSSNPSPRDGYLQFNNSGWHARNSGRSTARSLTDRMCFSYDSARAAYELAAMSPSTSSNSSSSLGPPSESPRRRDPHEQQNSLQIQQFQDDLRRHLPPLQTSESSEFLTQTSPGTCPSTLSPSSSSLNQQTPVQRRACSENHEQAVACLDPTGDKDNNDVSCSGEGGEVPTRSIVYDLTGSLQHLTSSPSTPFSRRTPEERWPCTQSAHLPPPATARSSLSHQNSLTDSPNLAHHEGREHPSSLISSGAENSRNVCNNTTPSPPTLGAAIRRSQSGISVCSETGEKKLSDGKCSLDPKILASDSQYPEHHSLSRSKPGASLKRSGNSSSRQVEEINPNVLNSITSCNDSKDVSRDSCQVPPTLFVPPTLSEGDEGGLSDGRVASSEEMCDQGELYGACVQENDLNKGLDDQAASHNSSAFITSLNISPPSPFVTVQSGQLIPVTFGQRIQQQSSGGPVEHDARTAANAKSFAPHEGSSRKVKKKKSGKDKYVNSSQPSPRHRPNQKLKHAVTIAATNLSHSNNGVGGPTSAKINHVPCQEAHPPQRMSSKFRPSRGGGSGGEKKKQRAAIGVALPADISDSPSVDWTSRKSCDDTTVNSYGNADVYRSYCYDSVIPPTKKSVQPLNPIDYPAFQRSYPSDKFAALGTLGEENHHNFGSQQKSAYHPAERTGAERTGQPQPHPPPPPPLTKKKPMHRRQASAGERLTSSGGGSPSRQRPKSLLASGGDHRGHGRRGEPESTAVSSSFDHNRHSVGKGAKSGFGQDLNFDDQLGMIDLFNHGVGYSTARTSARCSFSNDGGGGGSSSGNNNNGAVVGHARSHAAVRGVAGDSANHHQHSSNRSGLSNDLSFVTGCHPAVEKGRKRASLPSLPMFSSHSQGSSSSGNGVLGGRNHLTSGKADERVDREDRHQNSVPDEDLSQATSYV